MADAPIQHENQHPTDPRKMRLFLLCFAVLFTVVLLAGWVPRHLRDEQTEKLADQERNSKPLVETETITPSADSEQGLVVPGTTIPDNVAYVYARSNGYLKHYYVDIGQRVKLGQLLATVDAPDLDAQVSQAREQVAQAEQQLTQQQSQLTLATVTVQRYRVLVGKGVFSRQDGDTQEANYSSQVANVAAAQRNVDAFKANLNREVSLQSYEQVRSPFDGVITQRNVDTGALISASGSSSGALNGPPPQGQISSSGGTAQAASANNAGSSGSSSTSATSAQSPGQGGPLFAVSQVKKLRILVSVPESYAKAVHVGEQAPVEFQELPGAGLKATVTRTADSIDPNTRTLLTELEIDNNGGKLIAGMYAMVSFPPLKGAAAPLTVSDDAIAIRHDQTVVATVADNKVHYVPISIGRDYGNVSEVLTGLKAGDVVVTQVNDEVVEGAEVRLAPRRKNP
jgi:multidrug efflux pump subunit AcrA (membrane-fusion protein)